MTALDNALLPVKGQQGENPLLAPFHRLWRKQEAQNAQEVGPVLAQYWRLGELLQKVGGNRLYKK